MAGTATLDITTVNDAPTTSSVTLAAIAEDSGVRVITQAQLLGNVADVDLPANSFVASALAISAGSGTLVDNLDGTWNYTPTLNDDSAVSFSYTITDNGTTNGSADLKTVAGTATLDITTVNDAPSLSNVDTFSVNATASVPYAPGSAAIVIDADVALADRELGFERNNWAGATLSLTRQGGASSDDVFGASGSLSLSGGNVFVGATSIGSYVNGAGTLTLTFNASATTALVDSAVQALTYRNANATPNYASVTLVYTLNDQNLNASGGGTAGDGQDQGAGGALIASANIQIFMNHAPTAANDVATVFEGVSASSVSTVSGNVVTDAGAGQDSDVDHDTLTVQGVVAGDQLESTLSNANVGQSVAGIYGSLNISANGSFTYTLDNSPAAIQALAQGQHPAGDDVFSYTIADGKGGTATATVTITITGSNDAPVATGTYTHGVSDSASLDSFANLGGTLSASDVDSGDSLVWSGSAVGSYGALTVNGNGSYSYLVNAAAVNALQAGSNPSDSFTVTVTDSKGATDSRSISINLVGADDTPVASGTYTHTVSDTAALDSFANLTGTLLATDRDNADVLVWSGSAVGSYGALNVNSDGSYSYVVNAAAVNALQAGSNPSDSFVVTVSDSKAATDTRTVTITVSGANDAPVAQADVANATEAGGLANGTPGVNPVGNVLTNDTDVDSGDSKTVTAVSAAASGVVGGVTAGAYGQLTLNADGSYSYQVDNANAAVQALRQASDTLVDTFRYTMQDAAGASSSATLTVTLHGANDGPQALADNGALNAGATLTQSAAQGVLANDVDVDGSAYGESRAVVQVAQGSNSASVGQTAARLVSNYGTLTLGADGSYSYVADGAASQNLWSGDTAIDTFTYTVRDSAGASSSATLTLRIAGTNLPVSAAPVVAPDPYAGTLGGTAGSGGTAAFGSSGSVLSAPGGAASGASSLGATGVVGAAFDGAASGGAEAQGRGVDGRTGTVTLRGSQSMLQSDAGLTGAATETRRLESTDRGFQVERMQSESALSVTLDNQQKGGDRLFVYKGVGNAAFELGQKMEYRIPKDAFAHTNSASVVQLEASLVNGQPLPDWLDFDPISGAFSGKPPSDAARVVVIRVTARDDQGRETSTTFTIRIEGQPTQSRAQVQDVLANLDERDSSGRAVGTIAQRGQAVKRGNVPFSDQLKLSKRDPLIEKILAKQTVNTLGKALDRLLG